MKTILLKIATLRMKRGLGRGNLASIINVNTNTYTKMEKGAYVLSMPRLQEIADALKVECDALLDNDDPEAIYLEERYSKAQEKLRQCHQLIISEQSKLIDLHEKLK
ncbi:DNA-binding XRE family transcriptional regulator [Pedobacter sp. CG_S7]|uniref:helix-turn-helix domain-containing protein n=1 Tax=Pedobacter sp. CG_S7 TaxID=3143930 RepID=UPI003394D97D